MAVPDFLTWHCANCGAAAEGKKKPCECVTNVGTREGPNGKREQTWWEEEAIDWKANYERVQEHLGESIAERDAALKSVMRTNLANIDLRCRATNAEERLKEIAELAREGNLAVNNPYEALIQIAAICREAANE